MVLLLLDKNFLSLVSDMSRLFDSCVPRSFTNVVSNVVDLLETNSLTPSLEEKCDVEYLLF